MNCTVLVPKLHGICTLRLPCLYGHGTLMVRFLLLYTLIVQ